MTELLLTLKKIWDNRYVIGALSLTALIVSFYIYYLHATHTIETLTRNNVELETALNEQKQITADLEKNYTKVLEARESLQKEIEKARVESDKLQETLTREARNKKSLEELARKKTSLIEKKINNATEKTLNCFEKITEGGDCE